MSKYTFIRFITSCNRDSLVSWSRGARGSKSEKKVFLGGRAPLGRRAPQDRRALLSRRVVFWGFHSKLKLPFEEYRLVLGFCS